VRTERLVLRAFRPGDLDAAYALRSDPRVMRYLYQEPVDREGADQLLAAWIDAAVIRRAGDRLVLAAELASSGAVVGRMSLLWASEEHAQAEIGFAFLVDHQGRGYATEAARVLVAMAFEGLGAHRVTGRLDARNAASARVLERLGMRQEALLVENEWVKGEWTDEIVYAMLHREWAARPT
jgi:RimJ/RimL family protein N-acetyltransferase